MEGIEKFKLLALGTSDVPTWLVGLLFALLGLFVYYYKTRISKRDVDSPNTPEKFSLGFFLQDNLVDIFYNLVLIFIALRFSNEFAGAEVTPWYSFGIGLGLTKVSDWICTLQGKARE